MDSGLGEDAMSHQARTRAHRHTNRRSQQSLVHKDNETPLLHLYYNAHDAWLRSVQKEIKSPKSFLELLGIIRLANVKVRRHDYSKYARCR